MRKFPLRVTLLLWLVLSLTVWNAIRVWTALAWRAALDEFAAAPNIWIVVASGILWIFTGIAITIGVWNKSRWTSGLVLVSSAVCSVWYWIERLAWQRRHANWPFALIVNLIALAFVWFAAQSLANEEHERKPESQEAE